MKNQLKSSKKQLVKQITFNNLSLSKSKKLKNPHDTDIADDKPLPIKIQQIEHNNDYNNNNN